MWSPVNNMQSSSFQHSMHDHTCQYINMGEQRISIVPASIKSLPHMSFLDHHSSCIIGNSRVALENVHKVGGQNMTTIELSSMEAFLSNSSVLNTRSTAQQFK